MHIKYKLQNTKFLLQINDFAALKTQKILFKLDPLGFKPRASRVLGERDNHYTMDPTRNFIVENVLLLPNIVVLVVSYVYFAIFMTRDCVIYE